MQAWDRCYLLGLGDLAGDPAPVERASGNEHSRFEAADGLVVCLGRCSSALPTLPTWPVNTPRRPISSVASSRTCAAFSDRARAAARVQAQVAFEASAIADALCRCRGQCDDAEHPSERYALGRRVSSGR